MIELSGVSKDFVSRRGTVAALRGIDLVAAEGEFVAVVGRSGCGKSTLLRIVAGLLTPTTGQVRIAGEPVTGPRPDVSILFQRPALLPWRTVLANVLLPIEIAHRRPTSEHLDRARGLLETMGLTTFQKRLPHELSGGMQQRVALCRSLIQQPRVLLMDEPFSALDALTREELAGELQRLHQQFAATVVLVTHSIEEAVLLADRVIVFTPRPGRVRTVLDIGIPRPRTLGTGAHAPAIASRSAELHQLLVGGDDRSEVTH